MSMPHRVDDFWLPDDTEEDLVGADWHQYTIDVVYDGTRDVADLDHLPWHVGNQLTLVGWTPRGVWRPAPDIAIYPTAGPELRKEMSVKNDGPPTLVMEVASPWRRMDGVTRDWRPEVDGSYRCASLGISLRPEGIILRVIDRAGRPISTREERLEQLAEQARQIAAQEETNAAQAHEILALREEIARLRSERLDSK